jgi:hypothetical protein
VLAAQAPNLHGVLLAAKAAGYSHVNHPLARVWISESRSSG